MKDMILQLQPAVLYVAVAMFVIWLLTLMKDGTWLKLQIEALNLLAPTILGFIAILIGAGICLKNVGSASSTGNQLITGGFALITGGKLQEARDHNAQTRSTDPPPVPTPSDPAPKPDTPVTGGV